MSLAYAVSLMKSPTRRTADPMVRIVDHDVAVVDELTGGGDAAGKAEPEDNVIETSFEEAYETFDPIGLLEGAGVAYEATQLLLAQAIVEEKLLLFAQLGGEFREFFIF
jgi:hypothetical protein